MIVIQSQTLYRALPWLMGKRLLPAARLACFVNYFIIKKTSEYIYAVFLFDLVNTSLNETKENT